MGSREKAFQFLREVPRLSEGNIGKLPGKNLQVPKQLVFLLIEFYNNFKFHHLLFIPLGLEPIFKAKPVIKKPIIIYTHPENIVEIFVSKYTKHLGYEILSSF